MAKVITDKDLGSGLRLNKKNQLEVEHQSLDDLATKQELEELKNKLSELEQQLDSSNG